MVAVLDRVQRNCDIVELALSGMSVEDISAEVGLKERQIYNILSDEDYRKILEQGQRDQIFLLPKANKRLATLLDSQDEKIQLGAVKVVHQNTGITPAHTQNVFIGQLIASQTNIQLDSAAASALGLVNGDIQPAELMDEDNQDE